MKLLNPTTNPAFTSPLASEWLLDRLNAVELQVSQLQVEKADLQFIHDQTVKQLLVTDNQLSKFKKLLNLLPVNTFKLEIDWITVSGGTFKMGSRSYANEQPVHSVTLSTFQIGKYPVTQAQWKKVMGYNPSDFVGDDLPVETVSWNDVQLFLHRLNAQSDCVFRLPTEAEWEFAARGGQQVDKLVLDETAWYSRNSGGKLQAVGLQKPNLLGIYDMLGNVWEWCADGFGAYPNQEVVNPKVISTSDEYILRGGSWYNTYHHCRATRRHHRNANYKNNIIGFRLACDML